MRHRAFIAVVAFLVALLGGAVAVYAYDSSRDDLIAEGVRVGGVDLGGMRAAEARAALERELAAPLRRPVRVRYGGRTFRLSARRARLTADVDAMVADALERSREGNVVSRTARAATGGRVDAELSPRTSYSPRAVKQLVRRVQRTFDRAPRDARVSFSGTGIATVPGRRGVAIRARRLERDISRELVLPAGDRVVRARAVARAPEVTRDELAGRYPRVITVSRGGFTLRLYKNLRPVRSYRIAVGKVGLETPAGLYKIQNKAVDPAWHVPNSDWAGDLAGKVIPGGRADNPIKARWMGIYNGAGIHGTDQVASLGTNASHGCIRMAIPEVKELYDQVDVGTTVYIS